ncbi:hypothetical protein DFH11DRAFT_1685346 [Phellopilus nigrolimitatus]|nr:hypothetical protein DFH11DRAFT_1685346 [Phellopilus nigrolimitatus]
MTRKRKTSARPKTPADATKGQSQPGSDQGAQKLKRKRQSTFKKSTAEGLSDTATSGTEGNASESETQCRRKRRRRSTTGSTSTRGRRSRNPSVTAVFDPNADPGEELDPTVVTMASICDDTGQGRVSSKAAIIQRNHLTWKATNKEKRARMRAVMEAKKYGRPEEEANEATESSQAVKETSVDDNASQIAESSGTPAVEDASGSGFNYRESMAINRFNAQVRIGPNGETIIDEESLYVDRAEDGDDGTDKYTHVEESDQTKFVNSASYGRKIRGSRWSAEETELFYDALSQFGENYELISYVLPGRDRKSCKNKFKTEDKKNSNRITFCLNNRVPYDMQTLSRLTGRDFSGPTPEIRAPEIPTLAEEPQGEPTPEQPARKTRKKSRTPCTTDDVEVMGDVETFDAGGSDD